MSADKGQSEVTITVYSKTKAVVDIITSIDNLFMVREFEGRKVWLKTGGLSFVPSQYNLDIIQKRYEVNLVEHKPKPKPSTKKIGGKKTGKAETLKKLHDVLIKDQAKIITHTPGMITPQVPKAEPLQYIPDLPADRLKEHQDHSDIKPQISKQNPDWNPLVNRVFEDQVPFDLGIEVKPPEAKFGIVDRLINNDIDIDLSYEAKDYRYKTQPYNHQFEAINFLKCRTNAALFMDQGTGKTKVALDYAGMMFLAGRIDTVIVVGPKGVHEQWIDEQIPQHLGVSNVSRVIKRSKMLSHKFRRKGLLYIYAANYESLKSHWFQIQINHIISESKNVLFILDESHYIKNTSTKRWKQCKQIADAVKYRLLLTGTPIAKNLIDEWAQLKVLNENIIGIEFEDTFKKQYCVENRWGGMKNRNIDLFKRLTQNHVFRFNKEDLDISAKVYQQWRFSMTDKQKQLYNEIKQNLYIAISEDEKITAKIAIVMMQKLQQISNGFMLDENGKAHMIMPPSKNPRVIKLLEYLNSFDGQCIIWHRYRKDRDIIRAALLNNNISHGVFTAQKSAMKTAWMNGVFRVLICNPQSIAEGHNLHLGGCTRAIYYSNSENSIKRFQSEDRIHRIGVKGIVEISDLVARGTRDIPILANLKEKKMLSDYVLDDILAELNPYMNEVEKR